MPFNLAQNDLRTRRDFPQLVKHPIFETHVQKHRYGCHKHSRKRLKLMVIPSVSSNHKSQKCLPPVTRVIPDHHIRPEHQRKRLSRRIQSVELRAQLGQHFRHKLLLID